MNKSILSICTVALLAGAGVTPLAAQDAETYTEELPADAMVESDNSQYIGASVFDVAGQEVGTVDEIIVAADGSEEAVLSVGGFLGLGAKKITVAKTSLESNAEGTGYTIALTAEEIEAAPAYEDPTAVDPEPEM
jgi:hypothetical protein